MPSDHLLVDGANNVGNLEAAFLRGNLRVKGHLKEQIAQLFDKLFVIATLKRVQHLISLFDQVRSQRVMSLFAIPRAAAGFPQSLLNRHQLFKPIARGQIFR